VIRRRASPSRSSRTALISVVAVVLGVLAAASPARAIPALKTVRYSGARLAVPDAWPVFRLASRSHVCVRFNRHAVYLGMPGSEQICPQGAVGRTEAILVSPVAYHGELLTPVSRLTAAADAASMLRITDRRHGVVITATWNRHPATIRRALGLASLRAAMLASNGHRPAAAPARRRPQRTARLTSPESPATPGEIFNGLGFDVCSTPPLSAMSAWGQNSPYGAIGIYIGGVNAACLGGNLNAAWVSAESAAGWHLLPLYVGLQAPGGCCRAMSAVVTGGQYATAAAQGTAAAQDAVAQAQALGIGTGNPIYYDMEGYARTTTGSGAVLAFLQAWTQQLHATGYLSGVYSSGGSGVTDLVDNYGTTYAEPDEIWTADWDSSAPPIPPATPSNPYVPVSDWLGSHQLLQYWSDPTRSPEIYGGMPIGIDRDYVDAQTAAAGSGTLVSEVNGAPTLTITPQPNGWVNLVPQWPQQPGITQYTILAGPSPQALTALETISATAPMPIRLQAVYAYYAVQGLNSIGQVVGTSPPVQTPGSVAIFGNSAYVGTQGPVGIPVACLNLQPCQLVAQIFDGPRRIAHSDVTSIAAPGGQLLVPLSAKTRRLVTTAAGHHLPVTVRLLSASGSRATRNLTLVGYTVSGKSPTRRTWPGSVLQILGSTSYVSNAWTGAVLAACRTSVPCVSTVRVTLGGLALAPPRTTTLGPGEVGYLTYTLNKRGHRLLHAAPGNQLGARLTVSTASPAGSSAPSGTPPPASSTAPSSPTGGAGTASAGPHSAMALISLVAFR
jgi:hypothetical protein